MHVYHITYAPIAKTACLYFWGCNFSCRGCIRRRAARDVHLKTLYLDDVSAISFLGLKDVIKELNSIEVKKVIFLGGEPTLDPDLANLARSLHEKFQTHNVLLTNGSIIPSLDDIDEVCCSIKAYTDDLHIDFTGKSNRDVLKNFPEFYRAGIELRSESIFIPGYIDYQEIEKIARFIASVDSDIPYRIDGYIPVPREPWRRPRPQEVENAVKAAKKHLNKVSCLKGDEYPKCEVVRIV